MGGLRGQVGLGWSQIPGMKILFQSFSLQVYMIIPVSTYYILTFFSLPHLMVFIIIRWRPELTLFADEEHEIWLKGPEKASKWTLSGDYFVSFNLF